VFQLLVMAYETDPDNFSHITALMQQLQEYGNPPADIIRELAPGLELSPDGMPQLPNMGPGLPGMPMGVPGACAIQ